MTETIRITMDVLQTMRPSLARKNVRQAAKTPLVAEHVHNPAARQGPRSPVTRRHRGPQRPRTGIDGSRGTCNGSRRMCSPWCADRVSMTAPEPLEGDTTLASPLCLRFSPGSSPPLSVLFCSSLLIHPFLLFSWSRRCKAHGK